MRIYIAGPMSGYYIWNWPAFDAVRDKVNAMGFEAVSAADLNRARGLDDSMYPDESAGGTRAEALLDDLKHLATCDAIFLMTGWERSKGAKVELLFARYLDLTVFFPGDMGDLGASSNS